jgi:hypothetical protein
MVALPAGWCSIDSFRTASNKRDDMDSTSAQSQQDAPPMQQPPSGYEFTQAQNTIIGGTARYAKIWGILVAGSGALMVLGGLAVGVAMIREVGGAGVAVILIYGALALIPIYVGIYFMRAASALQKVVSTVGRDIQQTMDALDNLRKAFKVQVIFALVWLGLAGVASLIAVIGGVAAA